MFIYTWHINFVKSGSVNYEGAQLFLPGDRKIRLKTSDSAGHMIIVKCLTYMLMLYLQVVTNGCIYCRKIVCFIDQFAAEKHIHVQEV